MSQISPKEMYLHLALARLHTHFKEYPQAIQSYERASELEPENQQVKDELAGIEKQIELANRPAQMARGHGSPGENNLSSGPGKHPASAPPQPNLGTRRNIPDLKTLNGGPGSRVSAERQQAIDARRKQLQEQRRKGP